MKSQISLFYGLNLLIIGSMLLIIIFATGCIENSDPTLNAVNNLTTQNQNLELKPVPSRDLSNLQLIPKPGEYFTWRGTESKLFFNDSNLTYGYLSQKDICPADAADVGDLGIVINQ